MTNKMNNISDKIYESTDNGLDIIKYYYPQAFDSVGKPNKAFKLRDETAPSAYLKQIKGIWRVTDFGEDQHARSPIDIVMREENVSSTRRYPYLSIVTILITAWIAASTRPISSAGRPRMMSRTDSSITKSSR